mmetsp:Transcript_3805/g.9194  ORF Transcript_3805/g.9194 Transcript_3805/m.9194 type:complete len:149 (+) Transcript_3805:236-682(+)
MTSKLISLARVLQTKTAAASRSAPAAITEPIKKLLGVRAPSDEEGEDDNANNNANDKENHQQCPDELRSRTGGLLSAVLARDAIAATATNAGGPISSPWAREERREAVRDYYHRAIVEGREEGAANERILEDPDLSIPVGDQYLYYAQ